MAFHIVVFSSSIANTGLLQVAGVPDAIVRPSGSGYITPPNLNKVGMVYGVGANLQRIQLQTTSLRNQPFPTFKPVNVAAVPPVVPKVHQTWDSPLVLAPYEELDAFAAQNSAGAQTEQVVVTLFDQRPTPVKGNFLH